MLLSALGFPRGVPVSRRLPGYALASPLRKTCYPSLSCALRTTSMPNRGLPSLSPRRLYAGKSASPVPRPRDACYTPMYRVLSELPVPTGAQFINDVVQVSSSVKDNLRDIKRCISTAIFVGSPAPAAAPAVDTGNVVASFTAPAGSFCSSYHAVLRETTEKKRYIEIWDGDVLAASKDVTETHGPFYSDEYFSALSFSPIDMALMYVAEGNEPTQASTKFKFVPHLGEGLAGRKRPTIFIFRWNPSVTPCQTSLASVSPILPQDHPVLFGQPVFSPVDKHTIYATGYEYSPDGRLLGIRWCNNRPSGIWEIKLPSTTDGMEDGSPASLRCVSTKLTPSNLSCRSPRIYSDLTTGAAKLVWLSAASGGPHAGTFSLHVRDLAVPDSNNQVLVDRVWEPRESDSFPGLYLDANLPVSTFITLGTEVFCAFSSTWGSRTTVLLISITDGSVRDLTPDSDGKLFSWSMLATDGINRLVCSRSSPTIPYEVVLGELNSLGEISWRVIHSPYIPPSLRTALSNLSSSIIPIPERGRTETVVIRPSISDSTPPCVQSIHGGPHGVTTTAFYPHTAFLALEGYTVSSPNYTGSVGFGESSIRALLGNCGTLDVQDCFATIKHLIELGISAEGKGKQFLLGGSHGGFLTSHLIGQFPDVFTAAVIRNPVITAEPMSSDIPDWYSNEWNINFPMFSSPEGFPTVPNGDRPLPPRRTPADSQRIFASTPMVYVDAVRAHVLLHLGGADLRVIPTNGLEYYHALKGNARSEQGIEMHWFAKEDHSLGGVETNRIVWETTRDWFNEYRT
ncbi:Peptidase-S9 domain-containing protein [Mycena sanguinolenta]|uniref:acylaminoacyl-peptidase n=1 Tax=Mycena sanguinolenta TaxID=230812 RepID=A0A8H6ZBG3_9AGAR|nr:Peptidase-S9 domain-containing protein [Mycena sanguinolenta]